ncbi:MAG: hypothetical protein ACE5FL_11135 [Myxococcota bacterium]
MIHRMTAIAALLLVLAPAAAGDGPPKYRWLRGIVYGRAMLSREERQAYWHELQALPTPEEQEAYWKAHGEKMKALALARGVAIEPHPLDRQRLNTGAKNAPPPYFAGLMSDEENAEFAKMMWFMTNPDARARYQAKQIRAMQKRAVERGVTYPPLLPHEQAAVDRDAELREEEAEAKTDAVAEATGAGEG